MVFPVCFREALALSRKVWLRLSAHTAPKQLRATLEDVRHANRALLAPKGLQGLGALCTFAFSWSLEVPCSLRTTWPSLQGPWRAKGHSRFRRPDQWRCSENSSSEAGRQGHSDSVLVSSRLVSTPTDCLFFSARLLFSPSLSLDSLAFRVFTDM